MRPRRPTYLPDQYYHIYNRGAHKKSIFQEEENYIFVLQKVQRYRQQFSLAIIAYCLMPNHYHFLVRQDKEHAAGLLPQRVFNSYTKAFNKRYGRSGTLFEGPYKVIHVQEQRYLLHVCRYIHANPVKDGIISNLENWPFSNYLEWVGLRSGTLVDRAFVQEYFPDPKRYRDFVLEYLRERALPEKVDAYLGRWEEA